MSNHDNATPTTPRELGADEIAAIRERFERYNADWHALDYMATGSQIAYETEQRLSDASERFPADVSALLAHAAALSARCRAYEADFKALAAQVTRIDDAGDVQIDDLEVSYGEMCDMGKVQLTALMAVATLDGIRKRREREAASGATDGDGGSGNGEAG